LCKLGSPFRRLDRSTLFETGTQRHAAAVRRRKKTKNYLQISQPSAMSLRSVNERYSRWEKETERYKSERLETSFTTAKSLFR
ncbi:hypothetical protein D917_05331, partial [Trichinella nativa]